MQSKLDLKNLEIHTTMKDSQNLREKLNEKLNETYAKLESKEVEMVSKIK
jgi:translation elongation factor EF-1beta